jgi:uncharacterized small protein (DUF1192 family)
LLYKAELARQQLASNKPKLFLLKCAETEAPPAELVRSQIQEELELLNSQLTETTTELRKELERLEANLKL